MPTKPRTCAAEARVASADASALGAALAAAAAKAPPPPAKTTSAKAAEVPPSVKESLWAFALHGGESPLQGALERSPEDVVSFLDELVDVLDDDDDDDDDGGGVAGDVQMQLRHADVLSMLVHLFQHSHGSVQHDRPQRQIFCFSCMALPHAIGALGGGAASALLDKDAAGTAAKDDDAGGTATAGSVARHLVEGLRTLHEKAELAVLVIGALQALCALWVVNDGSHEFEPMPAARARPLLEAGLLPAVAAALSAHPAERELHIKGVAVRSDSRPRGPRPVRPPRPRGHCSPPTLPLPRHCRCSRP